MEGDYFKSLPPEERLFDSEFECEEFLKDLAKQNEFEMHFIEITGLKIDETNN